MSAISAVSPVSNRILVAPVQPIQPIAPSPAQQQDSSTVKKAVHAAIGL
jgi:hypothetical protein